MGGNLGKKRSKKILIPVLALVLLAVLFVPDTLLLVFMAWKSAEYERGTVG